MNIAFSLVFFSSFGDPDLTVLLQPPTAIQSVAA